MPEGPTDEVRAGPACAFRIAPNDYQREAYFTRCRRKLSIPSVVHEVSGELERIAPPVRKHVVVGGVAGGASSRPPTAAWSPRRHLLTEGNTRFDRATDFRFT